MSVIPINQILDYVNQARTSPTSFLQYIQHDIDSFINDRQMPLYPGTMYSTNEGKGAWIQAKNFLQKVQPLPPYKLHDALNLTARDHATDMAKNGVTGHRGSDGSTLTDRIDFRCDDFDGGAWAENIGSAFNIQGRNVALKTVVGLIVDDGVPSRGHRQNIFSDEFQYIGICSKVQGDYVKTVMNFHSEDLEIDNYDSDQENDQQNQPNKKQEPRGNNNQQKIPQQQFQPQQQQLQYSYGIPQQQQRQWSFSSTSPRFNQLQFPSIPPQFQQGGNGQWFSSSFGPGEVKANTNGQRKGQNSKKPKNQKKVRIGSEKYTETVIQNGKKKTKQTEIIHYSDGSQQQVINMY